MPHASAHDVILEILRSTETGEWTGKTKLYKAFYFAHLFYAIEHPGLLTDWPIACMPEGPGIDQGTKILGELVRDGFITAEMIREGPYPEYRYRLKEKGRKATPIVGDPAEAIKKAALYCLPKTGDELSQLTHERSRSWNLANLGDILNIYIDIIPDEEYCARQERLERLDERLAGIFSKE